MMDVMDDIVSDEHAGKSRDEDEMNHPVDRKAWRDFDRKIHCLQERSTKNKANRAKTKYPSVQGSKSFSAMHYDQHKLVEVSETQQTHVASSGASVDEHASAREVLRERREHVHRVGQVLKGNSLSP
ncbi:hypothetical protein Adt_23229 [Abeliophyllum distichum]|uniref:Uncharacterized protein n=1 Tax=Abeliophyllum distichum TaxID=126358 RepID=A0ABD1SDQ0_9LAMI